MKTKNVKRVLAMLMAAVMLLIFTACGGGEDEGMIVGKKIDLRDINEFYCTYSSSTNPPEFRRYHFYRDGEKYMFCYEEREGDHWPLTEDDVSVLEDKEVRSDGWDVLLVCLAGGEVTARAEDTSTGGRGPWYYIYWTGDKGENQVYSFAERTSENEFNKLCEDMRSGVYDKD